MNCDRKLYCESPAYVEECMCQPKDKVKVEIPKALVGGSEVYQNDDVPYWYCDIKDGRELFKIKFSL